MGINTQTLRWQQPKNCLIVFDHFVGLTLKGLGDLLSMLCMVSQFLHSKQVHETTTYSHRMMTSSPLLTHDMICKILVCLVSY